MLDPNFPYKGRQIILSSDRVLLHSKNEGIFLFGKKMVALSSTDTINFDAKNAILIDSDKIELGHKASTQGEPIILGQTFLSQFLNIVTDLQSLASQLQRVSDTSPAASFLAIKAAGDKLYTTCKNLIPRLQNKDNPQYPLSKVTFTK